MSARHVKIITISAMVIYGFFVWTHVAGAGFNVILFDQWRLVPMLDSYFNGTLSFTDIVAPLNGHSIILYKILFLINCILFDLNRNAEIILTIFFMSFSLYLIYFDMKNYIKNNLFIIFAILCITLLYHSFSQERYWSFSLISLQQSLGLFLFMLTLHVIRNITFSDNYKFLKWISFFTVLSIMSLGLSSQALRFIPAIICVLILLAIDRISIKSTISIIIISLLFFSATLINVKMSITSHSEQADILKSLFYVFNNFQSTLNYAIRSFGSIVFGVSITRHVQLPVGFFVVLLYIFSITVFLYKKMWRDSIIPLALIISSLLYLILIIIARFATGAEALTHPGMPRYTSGLRLGIIGAFWIVFMLLSNLKSKNFKVAAISFAIVSVFAVESLNTYIGSRFFKSFQNNTLTAIQSLKNEEYDKAYVIGPAKISNNLPFFKQCNSILRENRLGPYSSD